MTNILYEDPAIFTYDPDIGFMPADGFNLEKRVMGEDSPTMAHTMVGIKRLNNLQFCIEEIIQNNIPGDMIETGVLSGGATIFMRGILKVCGVHNRRVWVCDSFVPLHSQSPPLFLIWILKIAASIPSKTWQKTLYFILQKMNKSFPDSKEPDDDSILFLIRFLQNLDKMPAINRDTTQDAVKSNFARYGLLDDQVVFLEGFFSNTLPQVSHEHFSLIRLDGDTYESTTDALKHLYPRLSPGGFCIIDDFSTFSECKKAVDGYRIQHGIQDEIISIDRNAAFWKKS